MAKDDNKEEKRDLSNDPNMFSDSLKKLQSETYLGNTGMVQSILATAFDRLSNVIRNPNTEAADYQKALTRESRYVARILLGRNRNFVPVEGWNVSGVIDEFVAKWAGSQETDPIMRISHAVLLFFGEMLDIAETAGQDGILDEQVDWQPAVVLDKWTKIFIGLDPATDVKLEN